MLSSTQCCLDIIKKFSFCHTIGFDDIVLMIWRQINLSVLSKCSQVSYFEVLVGQVILQAKWVHPLWQRFPGQLLDGVLLLTEIRQRLLHQHHLVLGAFGLRRQVNKCKAEIVRFPVL